MNNNAFGELIFKTGFKTKTNITLFDKKFDIVVKAKAYYETDGITVEQETAYLDFKDNKAERLKTVDSLLNKFADGNAPNRFVPRSLLFNRDGSYAILFDDKENEDDGVAVTLAPKTEVVSQDEYL
jgi:hypothetical protein